MTCPATGRQIDTGIETDQLSIDMTPPFVGRTDCPFCGVEHSFSRAEVLVCEWVDGVIRYSHAA
jgi:hypothetical protein